MNILDSSPLPLTAAVSCNKGLYRNNNEDNFYFNGKILKTGSEGLEHIITNHTTLPAKENSSWIFYSVFDGIGGASYGEVASGIAAGTAKKNMYREKYINPADIESSLNRLFQDMNDEVVHAAKDLAANQMGTTMVSLFFFNGKVWISNLGDSPGYLLRDGKLRKLTKEHTDAKMMEMTGILGRKPGLTQYLGMDSEQVRIRPSITSLALQHYDRLLICSDGLTDMVPENQIWKVLMPNKKGLFRTARSCVSILTEEALKAGGRDNITIIICDLMR